MYTTAHRRQKCNNKYQKLPINPDFIDIYKDGELGYSAIRTIKLFQG